MRNELHWMCIVNNFTTTDSEVGLKKLKALRRGLFFCPKLKRNDISRYRRGIGYGIFGSGDMLKPKTYGAGRSSWCKIENHTSDGW